MFYNRITKLFNINIPVIQAGMIKASGWRLARAVSNAGGLGLIGAGSMTTDLLREHIKNAKLPPINRLVLMCHCYTKTLISRLVSSQLRECKSEAGCAKYGSVLSS